MSMLLEAAMRSSLVLACGLVTVFALRSQPAALKHWALAGALVLGAAQPAINLLVPAWRVPALNLPVREATAASVHVQADIAFEMAAPVAPPVAEAKRIDWVGAAFVVWMTGAIVSLSVLLAGATWLMWLGAHASTAGTNWLAAGEAVRARLGIRRPVPIVITRHPALLVTWGLVSPVILLPRDAASWPADRIQLVLAHEMAHLVRRDWFIQLTAEVLRAISWFNPLFWIACARLRRESELACDDIVLDLGIGGTSYASHLVDLARSFRVHGRTWLPAPSIARPSTLERRVRAMLNPQVDRRPVSRMRRAALAAVLVAVAVAIASASQGTSSPQGKLADPMGRPMADATLRLSPVGNVEQVVETKTDAEGAFAFPAVPAGEYMLSVRYPGFTASRQRMQLSGSGTTIALQVQVGTLRETVTIDAKPGPREEYRRATSAPPTCDANAGGQLTPPVKVKTVNPRYKQEWLDANLAGVILMNARIGVDGKVRQVDVVSPVNAELEDEAIAAVSQWEFTPTYLNCEPVAVQMYVTVQFMAPK
jgi:beta-lactamase regulating signal transducer with metallopeptidase domain